MEVLAVSMRQEKDKRYTDWTVNSETTQNQYGQYIKSSKESTKKVTRTNKPRSQDTRSIYQNQLYVCILAVI